MQKLILLLIFSLIQGTSFAATESQSLALAVSLINQNTLDGHRFWQQGQFVSAHGSTDEQLFHVRYTKFGTEKGKRGSVVIAPGRTESSMKYVEVAYDFIRRGYSPVYAIDHRGQGFSDRMLANPEKGHVVEFDDYVDDFAQFLSTVVLKDRSVNQSRLFLISNSMGGAITTRYLQRVSAHTPFRATALFGPMLEIAFDAGMTESKARFQASVICLTGLELKGRSCDGYAEAQWGDYDPSLRGIDPKHPNPQNLTHSPARYELRDYLWNIKWPFLAVGGPTVRWVWQSTKAAQQMRKARNLDRITTPMLIVSGEKDIRVSNARHLWYCKKLTSLGKTCQNLVVPEAYHEVLMESDDMRTPAMESMWRFFESR